MSSMYSQPTQYDHEVEHNRYPLGDYGFAPDKRIAKRCRMCRRECVDRTSEGACRGCATTKGPRTGNGGSATPHLDAIRTGAWTPGAALRDALGAGTWLHLLRLGNDNRQPAVLVESRKPPLEIAVCHGCGCVRLKPVGALCGHVPAYDGDADCREQGRLF